MLSHKNLMADLYGFMHYIKVTPVSISVLPLHHSFESTCHILGILLTGNTLCFNDSLKHMMENLARFKPGMSLMVPLFIETIYKRIWQEAKRENLDIHLRYGIWYSNLIRLIGIDCRRIFFKPILDKFGGELRQIVCGGAPLRTDLIKKLDDIGINIINGYGITECAPVISTNASAWKKKGTVGKVLPGCKVRIADPDKSGNGEIQIKGDIVMMGYYKDEENTKAVFTEDGYFMTGDMGRLTRNNFLYITGRKKNLIILSNGKNICPEELEEAISGAIPYIKEVMVYAASAGGQETINADVFPDAQYIQDNGIGNVQEQLNEDIRRLNNTLPVYKRINKVSVMEHEFEKTTTKKIKRQVEMKRREYNDKLCVQENS
jgi:long-chain acyl-CoA synthetase